MAFEDRSSPNTGTSPQSECNLNTTGMPNSPESSRTSAFTCTTLRSPIIPKLEHDKTFLRITSYALPSPKHENQEQDSHSEMSNSPPLMDDEEPRIQTLKYSITNILQPDFGKSAVLRTKGGSKISFKPYERTEIECKLEPKLAPLGSLCQTVSQIGKISEPEVAVRTRSPSPKATLPNPEDVAKTKSEDGVPQLWPAWVYCTRYSDRPSSGPRSRRMKKPNAPKSQEDKRPRTAFSGAQLARLKHEFAENRYLTERRRQQLSAELGLNEAQIKIWFQNKRAKIKKASGEKNPLALQLMAQGLYNHSTVACDEDDMPLTT